MSTRTADILSGPGGPQPPPHNFEAEMMVLANALAYPAAFELLRQSVRAEHFADDRHGRIWEALCDMADAGTRPNVVTLKAWAERAECLADLGGQQYLAKLASSSITPVNARDYARTVIDLWRARALLDAIEQARNGISSMDPATTLGSLAGALLDKVDTIFADTTDKPLVPIGQAVALANRRTEAAFRGEATAIPTGLSDLDARLGGGLERRTVTFIAARPGLGKTGLALRLLYNTARAGYRGLMTSLEMPGFALGRRLNAALCGIPIERLKSGQIAQQDFQRLLQVERDTAELPLLIDERSTATMADIGARARIAKRRGGLDLLVIDHLHKLSAPRDLARHSDTEKTTAIARSLRPLAFDLDIAVVLLCQLSREVEKRDDKRPRLADLRQSGAIEEEADIVLMLYRAAYYAQREQPLRKAGEGEGAYAGRLAEWEEAKQTVANLCDVLIEKQRDGPPGVVQVHFDEPTAWFSNLARVT